MNPLGHRFERVRNARVLVVGDIMLDRYTWGNASRVSPETPVLVLRAEEEEVRLGGAASVACLLRHLDLLWEKALSQRPARRNPAILLHRAQPLASRVRTRRHLHRSQTLVRLGPAVHRRHFAPRS